MITPDLGNDRIEPVVHILARDLAHDIVVVLVGVDPGYYHHLKDLLHDLIGGNELQGRVPALIARAQLYLKNRAYFESREIIVFCHEKPLDTSPSKVSSHPVVPLITEDLPH